jgi:hypothetical protein
MKYEMAYFMLSPFLRDKAARASNSEGRNPFLPLHRYAKGCYNVHIIILITRSYLSLCVSSGESCS